MRYHRVQLSRAVVGLGETRQQPLNLGVVDQFFPAQTQNIEGLLLGDEAALDAQSLFSHLGAAFVHETLSLVPFFVEIVEDASQPLLTG